MNPMVSSVFARNLLYRSAFLSIFLLTVFTAISAKSIKIVTSWFNPKYEGQTFHKVLVIGVAQDLEVRADFEDDMAAKISRPGIETIPGNQILLRPDPKAKPDLDYLRTQIRDNHIDAVVVSRLLKVDKKVTYIPSSTYVAPFPYYYSFYGYLGAVYPVMYDPGYKREDTSIRVETNVYSTSKQDGGLVWTGVSDSFNPKSAKKVADGLVNEVPKQMEKDGLLHKEPDCHNRPTHTLDLPFRRRPAFPKSSGTEENKSQNNPGDDQQNCNQRVAVHPNDSPSCAM